MAKLEYLSHPAARLRRVHAEAGAAPADFSDATR